MSASSKKILRKEAAAAELTEKQQNELKETKKLKRMTTAFVIVLALIVCAAVGTMVAKTFNFSGMRHRNTHAVTVGEHELNSTEFNYFYMDAVNNFYSNLYQQYGKDTNTYAAMLYGVDFTKPLDEQVYDEETGETWGDFFIETAKKNAQSTYALYDASVANNFELTQDQKDSIQAQLDYMPKFASMYGYPNLESYLTSRYNQGADVESYTKYFNLCNTAVMYKNDYASKLTSSDEEIQAADAESPETYNAYSYTTCYLSRAKYMNSEIEEPTDEDYETARAAAEADAKVLLDAATSVESLDKAYAALEINKDVENAASSKYKDVPYGSMSNAIKDWVTDASRKAGDVTIIPSTSTTTNEDGTTTENTLGYYVIIFDGVNTNTFPLANVRHILVKNEGGTADEKGNITYSDEEKAATKKKAEDLLNQWKSGDATEESFAALATENTADTGSAENGGLYEDVLPASAGQMVESFANWCFDNRKAGDTGIIESSYGYHVMYYCGNSTETYRDYLISSELMKVHMDEWYNALVEATTVTEADLSLINTGLILSRQG